MAKLLGVLGLLCIFMRYATGVRSMPKEEKEHELIQQLEDEDVMPSLHDLLHDNNLASTPFPSPSTPRVASGWSSFGFLEDVASGLLEEEMESTEERQTGKKEGCSGGYAKTTNLLGSGTYGTVYEAEKKIDEKPGSEGLALADFGLAVQIGKPISAFNEEDYMSAFYIIVQSFTLQNGRSVLMPTADPKIDLCSLAFMIYRIWNKYEEPGLQKKYATGVRSMPKEEKEYELIQQLDEDVMASLHELNKSATTLPSPITPRVKVFGSSLEGFEDVPSGLLEKEMESTEERQIGKKLGGYMGCRDGYAKTKKVLGAGVYGTVYEVEKKIHEKPGVSDFVGPGVLSMIDKSPCVDGKKMPNSYVTKMYAGDLHKWSKVTPIMTRVHCYQTVFSQVAAGLTCMHEKGDDPLKIVRSFELENGGAMLLPTAIPKIDLCSAAFMIYRIWNYKEPALQKLMGAGTCGPMGPGRTQLFP
eukprot:g312.t1